MKRVILNILMLPQGYVRGLTLLFKQPRLVQDLQERVQQLEELGNKLSRQYQELRQLKQGKGRPPVGEVNFGHLRRSRPISGNFGFNRGQPIDRYYIEKFLSCQAADIRGRVLEIKDARYTRRYGGERVSSSDVLDVAEDNRQATIVADLTHADHVPSNAFDCIIFTQTLHLIYDVRSAIRTLQRILKPGGVLLATFPGIGHTSCRKHGAYYRWAFTQLSARQLFEEVFPASNVKVEARGNVLAAVAFLYGLAVEDLRQEELDHCDPDYEVLITLRAVKPEATP